MYFFDRVDNWNKVRFVCFKYSKLEQEIKTSCWRLSERRSRPHIYFLDWDNRNMHKCRRHEHTAPGDYWEQSSRSQPYKAHFYKGGGGYNAASGDFTGDYQCMNLQYSTICLSVMLLTNKKNIWFEDFMASFNQLVTFVHEILFNLNIIIFWRY